MSELKFNKKAPMYSYPWAMATARLTKRQREIAGRFLWLWKSIRTVCRELNIGNETFKAEVKRIRENKHAYFLREMFNRRITYNPTSDPDMARLAPKQDTYNEDIGNDDES